MKPKKGQGSLEYILLVAGAIFLVLIIVVVVRQFFFNPGTQQVVNQGSLVQQQFGSLSKAMEKGKPLAYRKPIVYEGLAEAPVDFTYGVQSCIHRVEFWSNLSGTYELTNTIEQTVDPETTGDYNVFLNMTQDSIVAPGLYEFNVNVCNCQNSCEWMYADENNTPINQVVEIVPQADPRYNVAKQKYLESMNPLNQLNHAQGPINLTATTHVSWACDLGIPLAEASAEVRGDALQTAQLKCDINGRRVQSAVQNIQVSNTYHFRFLDQNAQGQSTCFTTACNTTDCIDSSPVQSAICQVQPQAVDPNPTANFVVLTLTDPNTLTFNYNVGGTGNTFTAHAIYASNNRGQIQEINRENLGEAIRGLNSQSINVGYGLAEVSNVFGWYVEVCNENNNCITSNMRLPHRQ